MEHSSPPQWDLDSDEIASIASQDLHDNRPNRWAGSQAAWRRMTVEERRLWQSMKLVEDQDLALHLYDAFALKRRGRDPETAQDLTVTMENGQQGIWAPPKVWTAWPLSEGRVPEQRLHGGEGDDDEDQFTFRRVEERMPSSELQEELAATILRLAKERFHKKRKLVVASIEEDAASSQGAESGMEGSRASISPGPWSSHESAKMLVDEEEAEEEQDEKPRGRGTRTRTRTRTRTPKKTYAPVMSTNDELSYELLRPSVRHILSQLDTTLKMLHNARVATADYASASDSSATDEESESQPGRKRGRGRPRSTPQAGGITPSTGTTPASRRGRPRKVHVPRDGETHEEMLVRIARESHRRLPPATTATQDDDDDDDDDDDREAAFEAWLRKGDERLARERALRREEEDLGIEPGAGLQERRVRRLGLRDWGDVVGAAALAGFSSEVIARTARRCAGLFGQGVVVRRLDEVPAGREPAFRSVEYRPEKIRPGDLLLGEDEHDDDSDDDDDDADMESAAETAPSSRRTISRATSRAPSLAPFRRLASSSPHRGRSSPIQPSASASASVPPASTKSRSRSRSSAGFFLCPLPTCERSAKGFSRRANLRRHMQLVHPGREDAEEEGDSEDEVCGAVHVDGFLKPIFPTRGWRVGGGGGGGGRAARSVGARRRRRMRGSREGLQRRETMSPRDDDDDDDDDEYEEASC